MAKSRKLKKKIKYIILIFFVLPMVVTAVLLSPLLNIGYVQINGNDTISREEVLQIAKLGEPLNIFYVDTNQVKNELEKELRIEDATVRRSGIDKIVIDLKERQRIAIVETHYGYVEVNYQGIILKADKTLLQNHLPLIKGVTAEDVYVGDNINLPQLNNVLVYLQWITPTLRNNIKEVEITKEDNVNLLTYQDAKIILGDIKDPVSLAKECNAFYQEIIKSDLPLDYANFSYARPVLKFKQ